MCISAKGETAYPPPENMRNISVDTPPILFLDMPFESGNCLEQINQMESGVAMELALMQYDYFTCRHEQAAERAAGYLDCEELKIRIGALLIFTFSSMAMGHMKEAWEGRARLAELAAGQADFPKASGIPLMLSAVKTVLHMPYTDTERAEIDEQSGGCDEGGRLLCCYLLEQRAWDNGEFERVIGAVEIALHMTKNTYPLIALYFNLSASESALRLKDVKRAEMYFQKAWALAEADGFWSPVAEMGGHLQLFLEKGVRQENPAAYRQIIQATHQYRIGWKKLVCEASLPKEEREKANMQETLTEMEYAVAFLAGHGWSNQEIGDYFGVSVRTVKYYMTEVLYKLNIDSRLKIAEQLD